MSAHISPTSRIYQGTPVRFIASRRSAATWAKALPEISDHPLAVQLVSNGLQNLKATERHSSRFVTRFDRVGFLCGEHRLNLGGHWRLRVIGGQLQCITEHQDYLAKLDESPDLRAAATLRSLSRIRTELERIPESSCLGDPVALKVQDVVLLARQLMSRLR